MPSMRARSATPCAPETIPAIPPMSWPLPLNLGRTDACGRQYLPRVALPRVLARQLLEGAPGDLAAQLGGGEVRSDLGHELREVEGREQQRRLPVDVDVLDRREAPRNPPAPESPEIEHHPRPHELAPVPRHAHTRHDQNRAQHPA